MTSWIVKIGKSTPQHWGFARDDGFWDVRRPGFFRRIEPGDDICFWLSGTGLLSRVRATSALYELTPDSRPAHWIDRDDGGYTHRFEFETVSEVPQRSLTWGELKREHGRKYAAQAPANEIDDPVAESHLRSLFDNRSDIAFSNLPLPDDTQLEYSPGYTHGDDLRERAKREIAARRGQRRFRQSLLVAYEHRCAVTGSKIESVLEAAHIDRYFGDHSNHVTNGLLLRADLHTLFDLQMWTVTDLLTIEVSPMLTRSEYASFDGRPLRVPANPRHRPDRAALGRHRKACGWTTQTA
ncbi:HNH endonuclease [Rhodococcus sp. NPDC058639]|uniref:HNH endonuclease n=1 Tax=Rhodococcus sp. NPDC058639 TaxID=3346570 RepID=UPI00365BC25A